VHEAGKPHSSSRYSAPLPAIEARGILASLGGGIVMPDSAIHAGFAIESANGEEIFGWITDPEPEYSSSRTVQTTRLNFALTLAPGEYQIVRLISRHPDLAKTPVGFPPSESALWESWEQAEFQELREWSRIARRRGEA